jgi:hypothetical protein
LTKEGIQIQPNVLIRLIDIEWFGKESIDCLLADREFVGGIWLEFLNGKNIRYYIRIRNNFKIYSYQKEEEIKAF